METMMLHLEEMDAASSGGILYVTIEDACFPEAGWYDLAVTDLELWLPRLISFALGHADRCTLQFMDGPAQISLERHKGGSVSAICLWNQNAQISETEIDLHKFLESVAKCIGRYHWNLYESGQLLRFESELIVIKNILNHQL